MWYYIVCIFYGFLAFIFWKLIFYTPDIVKYYSKFCFYIIATQIVSVVTIPIMALRPRHMQNGLLIARILKHVTKVLGVTWELRNGRVLEENRGVVIIANHQSSIDILGLYNIGDYTKEIAPVCKKEILYFFPFGLASYLAGCIFIDRKKPEEAHNTLKNEAQVLFKEKTNIWLFPEGTRNKNSVTMQPFRKGAFALAIACQVPIVPLVISPYYFLDGKKHIFNKGHAIIQCLEAVPTEGLTMADLPELKDRVQEIMERTYAELREEMANSIKY